MPGSDLLRTDPGALVAALEAVSRASRFTLVEEIDLQFDAHHPQGLCSGGGLDWVSTADVRDGRGLLCGFDGGGALVEQVVLTDGERFHPGGCDESGAHVAVPVAEYRPRSTTVVQEVSFSDLRVETRFRHDDHLGCIVELASGDFVAGTWGAQELVRFSADGTVLEQRPTISQYCDFQDMQVIDEQTILCTGLIDILTPAGLAAVGGLALLDVDELRIRWAVPITTYTATGRVLTNNPVRAGLIDDVLHLAAMPDDGFAKLLTYRVE